MHRGHAEAQAAAARPHHGGPPSLLSHALLDRVSIDAALSSVKHCKERNRLSPVAERSQQAFSCNPTI